MSFDRVYFEDEVRDGFYVSGIMKRAWASQLLVLSEIDRICTRHHIRWFADCGTLLGAVRHGGFIPWDDDLDICMLRDDYSRFASIAKEELAEGYRFFDYHTEGFWQLLSRVTTGMEIRLDEAYLRTHYGFPYVAGVDIFPLDFAAPDPQEEETRSAIASLAEYLAEQGGLDEPTLPAETIGYLRQIEELCRVRLDYSKNLRMQLYDLTVALFSLYTREEATELLLTPYWISYHDHKYRMEYFDNTIELPFEYTMIRVPARYDEILRTEYGEGYLQPYRTGGTHDYPYFVDQERQLEAYLKEDSPFYHRIFTGFPETGREEAPFGREKKEIVFLPFHPKSWGCFDSVWRDAVSDPDCSVRVIPLPCYDRTPTGELGELHYETEGYPAEVPLVPYEDCDLKALHPDVIYINQPYDDCNYTISVHPSFYAERLKEYTEMLVYIPWFLLDEIGEDDERGKQTLRYFVTVPGVVCADRVLVQSEEMRERYIEALTAWAGEETRELWEKKISGEGSPLTRWQERLEKEIPELPEEWAARIEKPDGTKRKVILFRNTVSILLEYGEETIEKLRNVFALFQEQRDEVVMLWMPQRQIKELLPEADARLWMAYEAFCDEIEKEPFYLLDESEDIERAIRLADAYYGDPDVLVTRFRRTKKPVMIEDVEITG